MKFYGTLPFATILLLIYPIQVTSHQDALDPTPAFIRESGVKTLTLGQVRPAAEQGDATAQFDLGRMYLQGIGVPQNYEEAAKWFRKAAEQGNTSAQCMLGAIYATGSGVTKDSVQAYMWLTLSIDGSKDTQAPFLQKATELRHSIVKEMTLRQIEEARRLAGEWKPVRKSTPKQISGNVLRSRLIKQVNPEYPVLAKRARVQGVVILVITVDEKGNVEEIRIARGHDLLVDAAVEAVKQWKYTPTFVNGEPIQVTATVTVTFKIGG